MAELPTKEELEQLYHKRGKDALVWYAWRNASRLLMMLGRPTANEAWLPGDMVRVLYHLCRMPIVVFLGGGSATGEADTFVAVDISRGKQAFGFPAKDSATILAKVIRSESSEELVAHCYQIKNSIFGLVDAIYAEYDFTVLQYVAAARHDHDSLIDEQSEDLVWTGLGGLWPESIGEPTCVRSWREGLAFKLESCGLGFLWQDMECVLSLNCAPIHAGNYTSNISEANTNSADILYRIIVGGEQGHYIHSVRVLLLGPGGAGKSSLADRLQGNMTEVVKPLTLGLDYLEHEPLDLQTTFPEIELGNNGLDLYLWDFGGQTIFHGLHSAFLHENCVYVLVVDSRHEQAPDEWLYQIRHLAGSQAEVLLVTNWYEQCETRQNEAQLLREFPDLLSADSFFYFSCLDKEAPQFREFVETLVQASLDSQKMVLKETLDVQEALQNQYQDDVFLDEDTLDEVIEEATGKHDIAENMTDKLQQLGFLVRVNSDGEQFCLKPAWAVDHAYQLLYSPRLREEQGVLTLADLKQEFKEQAQVSKKYTGHLVSFLQERSLCRRLQNDTYFFPDAAPANEPAAASQILKNEQNLVIRFDLPYLPLGFHARLVHSLFVPGNDVCIESPKDIWRQGFILRKGETKAVLHYLLRKNVIELVLVGKLSDFSALLSTLLVNLKAVMTAGEGMRVNQIHPSVKMHDQLFSVHSAEGLVRVMEGISNYGQLFERVRKMAADKQETHNYYADVTHNKGGDNSNFATKSESFTQNAGQQTVEITADQRKQIAVLADALLNNAKDLNPNELVAVAEVKKALEAPEQNESKSLLGKIWSATTGVTGFASNVAQIHQWGTQNTGLIAAAWAAGATLLP